MSGNHTTGCRRWRPKSFNIRKGHTTSFIRDHSMIASDLRTGIARLGDLVAGARVVVPFTGAGISTECGIPDFRSPGGIWTRMRPIPFDEFLASQEMRDEAWRRRFAMEEQ